jgi:hypothetical protein
MNYETLDRMQYNSDDFNNISSSDDNNIRTTDDRSCSYETTTNNSSNNQRNMELCNSNKNIEENTIKRSQHVSIYRYKFTNEFMNELYNFSKIHQYDHRKDFKESWKTWIDEKSLVISKEVERLTELGYSGDILEKMFTSARYYFRKKGTEKTEPKQRCSYIGVQKELLEAMDLHINENRSKEFKPSNGFENFCKDNIPLLKQEIDRLVSCNIKNVEDIRKKIKKTYKNRYFVLITK